jgi:glycosyltransferase involved in cell wall biosynthesis
VIEAYAAGIPVIATALGALPEMIEHGGSGMLDPPRRPGAWVEAAESPMDPGTAVLLAEGAFNRWARL